MNRFIVAIAMLLLTGAAANAQGVVRVPGGFEFQPPDGFEWAATQEHRATVMRG